MQYQKVKDLIKQLEALNPEEFIGCDLWTKADIESVADDMEVTITDGMIDEVLYLLDKSYDVTYGITWESVIKAINSVIANELNR